MTTDNNDNNNVQNLQEGTRVRVRITELMRWTIGEENKVIVVRNLKDYNTLMEYLESMEYSWMDGSPATTYDGWTHNNTSELLIILVKNDRADKGYSIIQSSDPKELEKIPHYALENVWLYKYPASREEKAKRNISGVYLTPTQESFDALVNELGERGYSWLGTEGFPESRNRWDTYKGETLIKVDESLAGGKFLLYGTTEDILDGDRGNVRMYSDLIETPTVDKSIDITGLYYTPTQTSFDVLLEETGKQGFQWSKDPYPIYFGRDKWKQYKERTVVQVEVTKKGEKILNLLAKDRLNDPALSRLRSYTDLVEFPIPELESLSADGTPVEEVSAIEDTGLVNTRTVKEIDVSKFNVGDLLVFKDSGGRVINYIVIGVHAEDIRVYTGEYYHRLYPEDLETTETVLKHIPIVGED